MMPAAQPLVLHRIADLRMIELPRHGRDDGEVVVAQAAASVPFAIVRLFTLTAPAGAERGQHAHRLCSQFMFCPQGAVEVTCDDGVERSTFALERSNLALFVPPTIWNTVLFKREQTVLAVLCDRGYEAEDYVRDRSEFLALRKLSA